MSSLVILILLIFIAALLYSSVGHAGASGYLAAMALMGIAPATMKPTALLLNILVGLIATVKFYRAGCFSWRLFWPFAITSVPFAFLGGTLNLPSHIYKPILGLVLLFAAYRLLKGSSSTAKQEGKRETALPLTAAMPLGAMIGILSGMTGVGGGIFLTPLLLLMGWAETKPSSGVSAAFILVNSIAGILGHLSSLSQIPDSIPYLAVAAGVGGWIGSSFGSRKFDNSTLRKILSLVLTIAALKMLATS